MHPSESEPRIITQHSGLVDPFDWHIDDFDPRDVGASLANTCRFGGHLPGPSFYSVAEHCLEMQNYAAKFSGEHITELRLACLIHDAAEAYLGDIRRPLKRLPEFKPYIDQENLIMSEIYKAHGITDKATEWVWRYDEMFADREYDWASRSEEWSGWSPECMDPGQAYIHWMGMYYHLCGLHCAYSKGGNVIKLKERVIVDG